MSIYNIRSDNFIDMSVQITFIAPLPSRSASNMNYVEGIITILFTNAHGVAERVRFQIQLQTTFSSQIDFLSCYVI